MIPFEFRQYPAKFAHIFLIFFLAASISFANLKTHYQIDQEYSISVKPVEYFQKGKGPHMLNIGASFPHQSLTLIFWDKSLEKKFPKSFHPRSLVNTSFKVSGKIKEYKGRPQIVIFGPDQLSGIPLLEPKLLISETTGTFKLLLNSPINAELKSSTQSVIGEALIDLINSTKETLDIATYGFRNQQEIYNAIVQAIDRGVRIRLVTDRDLNNKNYYSCTEAFESLVGNVQTDYEADLKAAEAAALYWAAKDRPEYKPFWPSPDGFKGPAQPIGYSLGKDKAIIAVHASRETFGEKSSIMHNKFVISDRARIWTGSCNLSNSGTGGYNANIACIIDSKEIADQYTEEFERMYNDKLFSKYKNKNSLINGPITKMPGGKSIFIGFSPQDSVVEESLIPAIRGAESSIDVAIFFLTHKNITAELIKAHQRGVELRVIIDATSVSNGYTKHKILREAGIPVKVENWGGKMHMKTACIDGYKLILGSMNWTSSGEKSNDENYLLLNSASDGNEFTQFFETLWDNIPDRCLLEDPDPESLASPGSTSDGVDNDFDHLVDSEDPGATKELYNSKPTPPHGFAKISSGFGIINGRKYPLIIGIIDESGERHIISPNDPKYAIAKNEVQAYFPSILEAEIWREKN
jgi:phosphatidylserine/phosphatidylglycerophosphate/cardiolipin synthase-like enzyme